MRKTLLFYVGTPKSMNMKKGEGGKIWMK